MCALLHLFIYLFIFYCHTHDDSRAPYAKWFHVNTIAPHNRIISIIKMLSKETTNQTQHELVYHDTDGLKCFQYKTENNCEDDKHGVCVTHLK